MNHHRIWLQRDSAVPTAFSQHIAVVTERTIDGVAQPREVSVQIVTVPANGTTSAPIDLRQTFVQNWTDNESHTERFDQRVGRLSLVQHNYPNLGHPENSTDLGGARGQRTIRPGGIAYITGEPAAPQLRAVFAGLPDTVSVSWRLEIRSERDDKRGTLDDRNIPSTGWTTLPGNQEWDIAAAMSQELVGGVCTLYYQMEGGNNGNMTFLIRGKNPLDADARAYIDATVGAQFSAYAWAMAKHESRQGSRVYNQFNTQATIEGTLNWGTPNGWGIAQIDRDKPPEDIGVSTAEVWNWHQNIVAFRAKLIEKQDVYNRFIGYFRTSYGGQGNWSEPPAAHTIGSTTLPAEAWGVMVLYNGAGGVPLSTTPTHPTPPFASPWRFNPSTGAWSFSDNQIEYAAGPTRVRPELENTIQSQE
jgi:hypothetical protein